MRPTKTRSTRRRPSTSDAPSGPGAGRVLTAWGVALAVVGGGVLVNGGTDEPAATAAAEPAVTIPTPLPQAAPAPLLVAAPAQPPVARDVLPAAPAVAMAALAPSLPDMPTDFVPASREGSTDNAPFGRIFLDQPANGSQAIAALGNDFDAVAAWYGKTPDALRALLLADRTLHVDRRGRLLHVDVGSEVDAHELHLAQQPPRHPPVAAGTPAPLDGPPPGAEAADIVTGAVPSSSGAPFPLDQTFKLHTRSGSTRTIYLNFKGASGYPAFDLDRIPGSFNQAEQQMIQRIWLRVAEDYAAFDVDVTTEPPTSTSGRTGMTILITPKTSDAGGYAYLNAFSAFRTTASAFCFPNNLANAEKPIAECISHEVGHTLGLHHQSTSTATYYAGQGTGETGWAPIMGVSYYKNLTQWSKGEYNGATNREDAYAVMARQGLVPRSDDHGNTIANATALTSATTGGLVRLVANGVIETPADADVFKFTVGAGDLTISANPSAWSGNVDLALELRDASGKAVTTGNPVDTLASSLATKVTVPSGLYYLVVRGTGKGDPRTTGYSSYGAIGQYSLSVNGTAPAPSAKK